MIDMEQIDVEESPATLAYVMLIVLSAYHDVSFTAGDDGMFNSHITMIDDRTGTEIVSILTSPVMGDLLIAVLQDIGPKIQDAMVGVDKHTWRLKR